MAFRGHYEYSLDAKKRLNIPPKFRPALAGGVVVSANLEPCVDIWTPEAFDTFTSSFLANLNAVSLERAKLTRFFAGGSFDSELDGAGRVMLNSALLAHAGIEKEVVVVGVLDHLEVWDRARWLQGQAELSDQVIEIAGSLGHPS